MQSSLTDRPLDQRGTSVSGAVASDNASAEALIPVQSRAHRLLGLWLPPIVAFVIGIGIWILLIRLTGVSPLVVPSPGDVAIGVWDNSSDLMTALWSTLKDAFFGLALSIVFGVGLSIIMTQSKYLERAIFPYATLSQTIPIFAIAPIIDNIAGGGHASIVAVAMVIAIFPMIANTSLGLTSVDNNQLNLFRMYSASRAQELLHLRLPFAIPYILTGLRVSSGLAIIGAIVGQVLLGNGGPDGGGLGFEIQYAAHNGDWGLLGAAALTAALLGIVVFVVIGFLSNLALRNWHESAVQHEN
jgi:NitT/TauT family transport system permease protein